jgi:CheY-like chemotaxis protein
VDLMSLMLAESSQVLVVDDDPDILLLVQEYLEGEGYRVTPADSLAASLALLQQRLFQFVLTDLFAQRERDLLACIHPLLVGATPIPVGVMTAWNVSAEAVAQAGLTCLLPKPFELEALHHAVEVGLQPALLLEQRQTQVIDLFFAALNARDWDRLARLCTAEVAVLSRAVPSAAEGHNCIGRERLRGAFERRFLALPGYAWKRSTCFPVRWGWRLATPRAGKAPMV